MSDKNQQIRERAYHLWEEQGRPDGMEIEHWNEARRELCDHAAGDSPGKAEATQTGEQDQPATPPSKKPSTAPSKT
jgi:Protein of unknown function (DUF2934)